MEVFKFGGWAVGTELTTRKSVEWVRTGVGRAQADRKRMPLVVVSATEGTTRILAEVAEFKKVGDEKNANIRLDSLVRRHFDLARFLQAERSVTREVEREFEELRTLSPNGNFPLFRDRILAAGELASHKLFAHILCRLGVSARSVDPRTVMITDHSYGQAAPDIARTTTRARAEILPIIEGGMVCVTGGFVGMTIDGHTTTLDFEGSDYSATTLAACLDAEMVIICKDEDGVFDKDPKKNPDARFFGRLSYDEAEKFAKHLHPRTIQPLVAKEIPLNLRNLNKPEHPGTLIATIA